MLAAGWAQGCCHWDTLTHLRERENGSWQSSSRMVWLVFCNLRFHWTGVDEVAGSDLVLVAVVMGEMVGAGE